MTTRALLGVWIAIDENGDYAVGMDHDDAIEQYHNHIGDSGLLALYHLAVDAPLPVAREATITLADDAPVEIVTSVVED